MKRLLFISIILQFNCLFAQDSLQVTESQKLISKGSHNAFTIRIPQAKLKDVISDWKKYLKQKNKSSIDETKGEYVLSKTIIAEVSTDSVIVYSTFAGTPADVEMNVFVTANDSTFYTTASSNETGEKIRTYIRNFGVNQYRNAVGDELANEQKKLKQLEGDLEDLQDDNDKSEKKISANERQNDRTEDEIKTNQTALDLKSESVTQQQKVLATFLDKSDLKSAEEKKLKDLEKEKKKLQKEDESLHKDIENNKSDNKALQKKIDDNNSETIPAKKKEIEKQKEIIVVVDTKMKGIR